MKVLHLPFTFYPDPVGGTEVYVEGLAQEQRKTDVEAVIAAPGQRSERYEHARIPVWRYPVGEVKDPCEMYGAGDVTAAQEFAGILEAEQPDLVHMHALTRGVSLRLARAAKARGTPVVFSYHTPTVSCQRGTLLHWGKVICDGRLEIRRCAQCTLNQQRLPRPLSQVVGSIPPRVGAFARSRGLRGGVWTALRTSELLEVRQATFRSLMAEVDHVVALCNWCKDVLVRNGVPSEKLSVSRQGLVQELEPWTPPSPETTRTDGGPLRIAFLGRLDPAKGAHTLIQALQLIPALNVTLDIHTVSQSGDEYLKQLQKLAAGDRRVSFREPIAARHVVTKLRDYDVLAVPSQGLETGPMVVLEAFAAGLPVIGSNLGGIAELVRDSVDGFLLNPRSPRAWAGAIRTLSTESESLVRLRAAIRRPRQISEAAEEMLQLYRRFVPSPSYA